MKYSELYNLIEKDNSNNKLKEIAELFLEAMNDWPTPNQTEIKEFIAELKEYFGSPITLEKIDEKKIEAENFWKHESGSTICEMIEYSKLYYNETDFDNIVNKIFDYYKE